MVGFRQDWLSHQSGGFASALRGVRKAQPSLCCKSSPHRSLRAPQITGRAATIVGFRQDWLSHQSGGFASALRGVRKAQPSLCCKSDLPRSLRALQINPAREATIVGLRPDWLSHQSGGFASALRGVRKAQPSLCCKSSLSRSLRAPQVTRQQGDHGGLRPDWLSHQSGGFASALRGVRKAQPSLCCKSSLPAACAPRRLPGREATIVGLRHDWLSHQSGGLAARVVLPAACAHRRLPAARRP